MKKFHILSFALSAGILWGSGVFFLAILGIYGVGDELTVYLADLYLGLSTSWSGAFIGLIWGFVDAFIAGAIFAWLYNFFSSKFS